MVKKLGITTAVLVLVLFGFLLGTALPTRTAAQSTVPLLVTEDERIFSEIYNRISPSVVSINIAVRQGSRFINESLGTGFVIDKQGHIVTNNHVVDGADRIEVNFFDGTIVRAEIVGLDPDSDLAVIKVSLPESQLQPIAFGNSDALVIGQRALAIGSPFGERWTLTTGIISALNRRIDGLTGYAIGAVIQTDAAINPGNSGGPLLNMLGEVIGVNSQILSQTRSNSGVGFAVPSNLVKRVSQELIARGEMTYSYLGITGGDIDLNWIESYNLPNNMRGVPVTQVLPNGPAAQAGIRSFTDRSVDIITAVDGRPLLGFNTLISYLAGNTSPGQTITLSVVRNGELVDIPVILGRRP